MKFLESLLDLSVPKLYSKKQEKSSEFVDFFKETLCFLKILDLILLFFFFWIDLQQLLHRISRAACGF